MAESKQWSAEKWEQFVDEMRRVFANILRYKIRKVALDQHSKFRIIFSLSSFIFHYHLIMTMQRYILFGEKTLKTNFSLHSSAKRVSSEYFMYLHHLLWSWVVVLNSRVIFRNWEEWKSLLSSPKGCFIKWNCSLRRREILVHYLVFYFTTIAINIFSLLHPILAMF